VGEREDKYGKTTLGCTPPMSHCNLRLQPKTASSLLPSVHKGDLLGPLGVRFDPFAEPSGKARSLRNPAEDGSR
jgi:hypothetical protein